MEAKPASFLWSEGAGILTTLSRIRAGKISTNLANAVPRMAQRFGTRLPRHLSLEQIGRILDAVRNTAPSSLRNYAMVLLMARLGLRPPEVVAMQIEPPNAQEIGVPMAKQNRPSACANGRWCRHQVCGGHCA